MSNSYVSELRQVKALGNPRKIGRTLGEAGRDAVHDVLTKVDYWLAVTDPVHADKVQIMADNLRTQFPPIWEELEGLAEGLHLPLEQVVAWNCRGDFMSNVPDGCTTVQIPGDIPVIGHNEDGLPDFKGHAMLAKVVPDDGPSFQSFCYPGSIPGHTFATNAAGLVQAVNNLRLRSVNASLPRMGVGRALLTCTTLEDALQLLKGNNACGGFHMTLAQAGDPRLMSIEFGGGDCSIKEIDTPSVHANHALHMGKGAEGQLVTASSRDRQVRGTDMLAEGVRNPLHILRDTGGAGLPVHRCHIEDPDNENTLASALFLVGSCDVDWSVYDQTSDSPVFASP